MSKVLTVAVQILVAQKEGRFVRSLSSRRTVFNRVFSVFVTAVFMGALSFPIASIASSTSVAAPPDTTSVYATRVSRWKYVYHPLRAALHQKIVERRMRAGVSDTKPRIIFTAGGFGAGKSFVAAALENLKLIDVASFLWIDPDSIKEEIPEYEVYKRTDPDQAATLVHRESGYIQEELLETALQAKKNIINQLVSNPTYFSCVS